MDNKKKDDVFYVCTLIEFIARKTKNHRKDVVGRFTREEIEHQLDVADLNHCLRKERMQIILLQEICKISSIQRSGQSCQMSL